MKMLGFLVETTKPDEASFEEFQQTYAPPLSPNSWEAIAGYSFLEALTLPSNDGRL